MRIISNFRDYYDGVMGMDQDRSILYYRKKLPDLFVKHKYPFSYDSVRDVNFHSYIIGFAGQLYPLISVDRYIHGKGHEHKYNYTVECVLDSVNETKNLTSKKCYQMFIGYYDQFAKELREFFKPSNVFNKYFAQAPIFLVKFYISNHSYAVIYNPVLKPFEFYRVLDVYTAYQNLRMFVEAQAQPSKPIPQISDEIMQSIKGFDHKYSFRKEPSK